MAQNDTFKRYLDAGMAFTQMTRERAEAIVQDLVEAGEIRRKEAQKRIEELLERSQKNTEELVGIIRREVAEQIRNLGLDDLAKRAGIGGGDRADNPTSIGDVVSETRNSADDVYPAPEEAAPLMREVVKEAGGKKPAKKAPAAKKPAPAKTTAAKKTPAKAAKKTAKAAKKA